MEGKGERFYTYMSSTILLGKVNRKKVLSHVDPASRCTTSIIIRIREEGVTQVTSFRDGLVVTYRSVLPLTLK